MSCTYYEELLHEYLENTIDPLEKIVLQEHLKICPNCRRELTELKLLYWELNNLPDIDLPKEMSVLKNSILCEIENQENTKINHANLNTYKNYINLHTNTVGVASIFLRFIPGKKMASSILDNIYCSLLNKRKKYSMRNFL